MECEEKLFVNHEIVKTFYVVENNTGEMIIDLIKNLFTEGF